ncbi:hypothetical protein ACFLXD_03385 [Chloroflexota bacterium]
MLIANLQFQDFLNSLLHAGIVIDESDEKFPPDKIPEDSEKARRFFERKQVTQIIGNTILGYGLKPGILKHNYYL